MIKNTSYTDIVKNLRNFLITYSGLKSEKILNALSARGTDLSVPISESESYSANMSEVFLLFELLEDQTGENYITSDNENGMMTIQSYTYHLILYGNESHTAAQKISALFKYSNNILELYEKGIFIKGVLPIETINEFINNTLIMRCDLNVNLQVRFNFENLTNQTEKEFNGELEGLIIKRESEI